MECVEKSHHLKRRGRKASKMVFMLPFTMQFKDLYKNVGFSTCKGEICEEIFFPFYRKMLMSTFLLRLEANDLERMRGYPNFTLFIPIAHAKSFSG